MVILSKKVISFDVAIEKSNIGGQYVSQQAQEYLKRSNIELVPQYLVKEKKPVDPAKPANFTKKALDVTSSFHQYGVEKTLFDFKEAICHVAEAPMDQNIRKRPAKRYEFPNGFNTSFQMDRLEVAEGLFNPNILLKQVIFLDLDS